MATSSNDNESEQIMVKDMIQFRKALLTFIPEHNYFVKLYPLKEINLHKINVTTSYIDLINNMKKAIETDFEFINISMEIFITCVDLFDYFITISMTKTFLLFVSKLIERSIKKERLMSFWYMINNFPYLSDIDMKNFLYIDKMYDDLEIGLICILMSISIRLITKPIRKMMCEICCNPSPLPCIKCQLAHYCNNESCLSDNVIEKHLELCYIYQMFLHPKYKKILINYMGDNKDLFSLNSKKK